MSEPKSLNSSAAGKFSLPGEATLPGRGSVPESNLIELAGLFAANHGGIFSADLALDVVLNEIVEQACLATGATGAAIVLKRDGEMVCRASSGATAPELGARLDSRSGVTGECLRTHRVQVCDDAQTDPRADVEASRRLGVRSVMVLPLVSNSDLAGVFEVFSTRASAFGERDQHTLEALAHRAIKNLESVEQPLTVIPEPPLVAHPIISLHGTETNLPSTDVLAMDVLGENDGKMGSRAVQGATWALGLTVLACTVLLGTLVVRRLGWVGDMAHTPLGKIKIASTQGRGAKAESPQGSSREPGRALVMTQSSSDVGNPSVPRKEAVPSFAATASSTQPSGSLKPAIRNSSPPAGGLSVYENGREVFRMPPSQAEADATDAKGSGVELAASLENEGIAELSPAAAQSTLVRRIEPEYPEEARQKQIQGVVVVEVRAGRDGSIRSVKLVSGQPLLADAAIAAVKQWRFRPHLVSGRPVEMQTKVTLNFSLPRPD